MRSTIFVIIRVALLCILVLSGVLAPQHLYADEFSLFTGSMQMELYGQYTTYNLRQDTLLNLGGNLLDLPKDQGKVVADIRGEVAFSPRLNGHLKVRPSWGVSHGDHDLVVDDFFLDLEASEGIFMYAGKKNIRQGVGFGANPTDFLGEGKEVDYTKTEEERRIHREGNSLVGADLFLADTMVTGVFAPKRLNTEEERDRFYLKASFFLEQLNTDLSLHGFYGEFPGLGLDISTNIGDALVLYGETALRHGDMKKRLREAANPFVYQVEVETVAGNYPHLVLGGHYTFKNNTNIIVEYIYNGDGYDSGEWGSFIDILSESGNLYAANQYPGLMESNVLQANSLLTFRELRRNYLFLRMSNPLLWDAVDASVVALVNLDDQSFLTYSYCEYFLTESVSLALSASYFNGDYDSEFGMMHWSSELSVLVKVLF